MNELSERISVFKSVSPTAARMDTSRAVAVAAVLAVVATAVVGPAAAFAPAPPAPQTNGTAGNGTAGNGTADGGAANATFGAQVSSFMQASAASANSSIESGVWRASVDRRPEAARGRAVAQRVEVLEARLDRLRNRSARLGDTPGESGVAYTARASALRARLDSLREAIGEANETARRVGVNTTRLDRLRDRAANVTGPEVPGRARGITDVDGEFSGQGPPWLTPPSNGNDSDATDHADGGEGTDTTADTSRGAGAGHHASGPPAAPGPGGPGADAGEDTGNVTVPDNGTVTDSATSTEGSTSTDTEA